MCYLSASNRGLFKSYYCCVLFFAIGKIIRVLWKIFLIPFLDILKKKSSLTNIRSKCVIRKMRYACENSLNLDRMYSIYFGIFRVVKNEE